MSHALEQATVEPISGGITRIALPVPGLTQGVNVHLVTGSGPTTLVDTGLGLPGLLDALTDALQGVGVAWTDVDQVLLTHHHVDHIGLAAEVAARSGATVRAVARVADVVRDPATHFVGELAWAERHAQRHGAPDDLLDGARAALPFSTGIAPVAVDVLEPGAAVSAGDLTLRVLARPGHSATDTVFQDDGVRVAFVGDHLWFGSPATPVLGTMGPADGRPAAGYVTGLRETRALSGYRLLAGHGGVIEDAPQLVDERLRALERRIARVRAVLPDAPTSTWDVGLGVWRPGRPGLRGLARLSALLAALELLEDRGAVRRVGTAERVLWVRA